MPTEAFPFPSSAPAVAEPTLRPSYNAASSRELAPFCGLHKVGGFSAQESLAPPSSAQPAFHSVNEVANSMPGLSMSQSSVASTPGSSVSCVASKTANKRSYDDEAEDDVDAYFDEVEAEEQTAPVEARRIAKLKNSPRKQAAGRVAGFGSTIAVEGDFEEAAFLAPMETNM
ncbi:9255_t:CDS:1 [Scutellospora calospora]|uniref:9255_t:CDS:1 n=1 Tax=Scutellospora calospora TaxID=85575 RepID=A0ACA9M833_9GLOM|nr:9255_t:CDS:1 [Scutellospora calospora]